MPLELPRIQPNFTNDFKGPSFGLYSFKADSRIETRVAVGCYGSNASVKLEYFGLDPTQTGKIMRFWEEINLDFDAGCSLYSFLVPKNHPVWRNLGQILHYIEDKVARQDLDTARWLLKEPSSIETLEVCGLYRWSCRIEEVRSDWR